MDGRLLLATVVLASLIVAGLSLDPAFPHIRVGEILRNNSVVVLGRNETVVVECVTDLNTCCSAAQGVAGRAWYLPNGTKLSQDKGHEISSFQVRAGAQRLDLVLSDRSARANPALSGVYECAIDTRSGPRQSVYVGLYYKPMAVTIKVEQIFFSGGTIPLSTITCVTVHRPATRIEWHWNGNLIRNGVSTTVLNDPVVARYTHTLTLSRRQGGEYECFVKTDNPFAPTVILSAWLNIEVGSQPHNVQALKASPTAVRVSWIPPEPLLRTVGYAVHYTGPSGSGTVLVAGGTTGSVVVTGLVNGQSYEFSVAGTSSHFESESVEAVQNPVTLYPDAPELTLTSITSDTMTLSWAVAGGTEVERYELEWKIIGGQKPISRLSYTLSSTTNNYTIAGLEECDNVTVEVRVAAVNEAGTTSSVPLSLNSAILRGRAADSEDEDITCSSCVMSTSNIGAIIAGVVGALLIGVFIGSVTVVIISRCTQNCRKKNKSTTNVAYLPSTDQQSLHYGQSVNTPVPVTSINTVPYTSDPATSNNMAYQYESTDGSYEYI